MTSTYDKTAFAAAHARMRRTPLELDEADLLMLAEIDPRLEVQAREARKRAQLSVIERNVPALQIKQAKQQTSAGGGRLQTPTPAPRALTAKHLARFADRFGDEVVGVLKEIILPLREQVQALEQRITTQEKKPFLKFRGVWEHGKDYSVGDCATCHGSLWACTAETGGKPGEDFHAWVLAVKKGSAR